MRKNASKPIALGGVMAALAVVIMCMGGLIPIATFVCPMFCMLLMKLVCKLCGKRIAWGWYASVSILSLLMGPDKEAAAVFVFLGYYPILKPWMDRIKLGWLVKAVFFNAVILAMYWLLINLFGMNDIAQEYAELGTVMTIIMLLMGNVTFFLLDLILGRNLIRK